MAEVEGEPEEKLEMHLVQWIGSGYSPLCGFTEQPLRYWPKGNGWAFEKNPLEVNCDDCLEIMRKKQEVA